MKAEVWNRAIEDGRIDGTVIEYRLAVRFADEEAMIEFVKGSFETDKFTIVKADSSSPEWGGRAPANSYVVRRKADVKRYGYEERTLTP